MALARITVLISGRGSNLAALIAATQDGRVDGAVTHVVSNHPGAAGLAVAKLHGIATTVVDHRGFASRDAFDAALAAAIDEGKPDLIVLAGFMRILGDAFVQRYAGRMLNIHPSLLPRYPGLDTHRRVLADHARVHGCSVHLVTLDVDGGPVIARAEIPVHEDDDVERLAQRVLEAEHRLLPEVVGWWCAGRVVIENGRVRVKDRALPIATGARRANS